MTHALDGVVRTQQQLTDALCMVADLRVHDLGQSISPPAAIIGPPRLMWSGYGGVGAEPTTCQWNVYLVMAINQYAVNNLLALLATVTATIENYTPGVVLSAGPDTYQSSAGPLPAYNIVVQCEVR